MSNLRPVLIYHGGCPDGFGASYAFWKKYGSTIDYVPMYHKKEPLKGFPESFFRDRKVWMLDISLEREDAIKANEIAKEFIIIDHHFSAKKKMSDLNFCHFDMSLSGAVLAWQHCFPSEPAPKILQYIQDRDLYSWKLPYAEELLSVIDSYEKSFKNWDMISERLNDSQGFKELVLEGSSILRYNKVLINKLKGAAYFSTIKGHLVPVINTPFFRPEILNDLSKGELFSAGYHYNGKMFVFSLVSSEGGLDVSEVAGKFPGGGGHRQASGFSVESLEELDD